MDIDFLLVHLHTKGEILGDLFAASKNWLQVWPRMWRKGNPCALLVGIQVGAATVENNNLKN